MFEFFGENVKGLIMFVWRLCLHLLFTSENEDEDTSILSTFGWTILILIALFNGLGFAWYLIRRKANIRTDPSQLMMVVRRQEGLRRQEDLNPAREYISQTFGLSRRMANHVCYPGQYRQEDRRRQEDPNSEQERNFQISERYRRKGNQAFYAGEYRRAIAYYTKALNVNPNSQTLHNCRGAAYMRLQIHKQAVMNFEYVLKRLNPTNMDSWVMKAVNLFKGNRLKEFEECIEEAKLHMIGYEEILKDIAIKIRMGLLN